MKGTTDSWCVTNYLNYFSCRFWYCIEINIFSKKVKTSFNFSSAPPDFWHEKNWNEICFRFVEGERRKGIFILCWIGMKLYIFLFYVIACDRYQNMTHNEIDFDICLRIRAAFC